MKKLLGVVVGVLVCGAVIYGLELLNHLIFPWPAMDMSNASSMGAAIEAAPVTAKVMLVGGWFLGALAGGLVAVRIAGWALAGWIIVLLVAAMGIVTVVLIPHPLWLQVGSVVAPLIAGLVVSGASGAA